jgi:hypothetical protein
MALPETNAITPRALVEGNRQALVVTSKAN